MWQFHVASTQTYKLLNYSGVLSGNVFMKYSIYLKIVWVGMLSKNFGKYRCKAKKFFNEKNYFSLLERGI